MHVTWDPEDDSAKQEFDFVADDDLMSDEAEEIEKAYGAPIEQWANGLRMSEVKARRLLLWWFLRQTHRKLALKDVPKFRPRQIKCQMSVVELQELWKRLSQMKLDEEKQESLRAAFEIDVRDAMEREGLIVGDIVGEDVDLLSGNLPAPSN